MGLRNPSEILIRASLYQRIQESSVSANCSMVVDIQLCGKHSLVFSRPKKPSRSASSGDYPLRDIERTSFASAVRDGHSGHR